MRQRTWKLESMRSAAAITLALLTFAALAPTVARAAAAIPDKIDFNRDVRPIFTDTCFACHGPDKNARKASLRLDTKEGAFAALRGGKGHVIVPGKTAESEVYRRVSTSDSDDLMPPPSFNK